MDEILSSFKAGRAEEYSPLALAYIGDAFFEIIARSEALSRGNAPVNKLHRSAREIVKAGAQSRMYFKIKNMLTEDEAAVFKRGRNANSHTVPKNADLSDYRHATGLEAVFGYLYLKGRAERALELYMEGRKEDE